MPRYICYLNGLFFEWSTIVDAPISAAMTPQEFQKYYQEEYGLRSLDDLPKRISRALIYGTSSAYPMSFADMIIGNRAGVNEEEITLKEIFRLVIDYRNTYGLPLLPQYEKI